MATGILEMEMVAGDSEKKGLESQMDQPMLHEGPSEEDWVGITTSESWDSGHSEGNGLSMCQVMQNIVTAVVGVGIYTIPYNGKVLGLWPSMGMLLFTGFISIEGSLILNSAIQSWNSLHPTDMIVTFEDFGQKAFGQIGRFTVLICMMLKLVLGCGAFVLTTSECMHKLFDPSWSRRWFIPMFMGPLWIACMLKDLKALKVMAPFGALTAVISGIAIVIHSLSESGRTRNEDNWPADYRDNFVVHWIPSSTDVIQAGGVMASFFYGFNNLVAVVPQNVAAMTNKATLPKAVCISTGIISVLYIVVLVCATVSYGLFLRKNVLDNMKWFPKNPDEVAAAFVDDVQIESSKLKDIWTQKTISEVALVASSGTVINLLLTYPLLMMHLFGSVQSFEQIQRICPVGGLYNYAMRTVFVLVTVTIGIVCNQLRTVGNLVGSLVCPLLFVKVPIIFSWSIRKKCGVPELSWYRLVLQGFAFVYCVLTTVGGVADVIRDLVRA